jgi:hypothetical protein
MRIFPKSLSHIISTKQIALFGVSFYIYFINVGNEIKEDKIGWVCNTHGGV